MPIYTYDLHARYFHAHACKLGSQPSISLSIYSLPSSTLVCSFSKFPFHISLSICAFFHGIIFSLLNFFLHTSQVFNLHTHHFSTIRHSFFHSSIFHAHPPILALTQLLYCPFLDCCIRGLMPACASPSVVIQYHPLTFGP